MSENFENFVVISQVVLELRFQVLDFKFFAIQGIYLPVIVFAEFLELLAQSIDLLLELWVFNDGFFEKTFKPLDQVLYLLGMDSFLFFLALFDCGDLDLDILKLRFQILFEDGHALLKLHDLSFIFRLHIDHVQLLFTVLFLWFDQVLSEEF